MTPWEVLGVGHDVDVRDLRRHYAALIKQFRPETHPQDFARIREAYEVALPHARRREAQAQAEVEGRVEDEAEAEAAPPPQAVVHDPGDTDDEVATREEVQVESIGAGEAVVATALEDGAASAGEPDLAARFHAFHALMQSAGDADDEALLPALRELLRARALASLDDSQALEFALMRSFVESDEPPLTLLFETGRAFDWHTHIVRLSNWLTPWALRRIEVLLSLSRDRVYARHFSGNARLRQLHAPQARRPLAVLRPALIDARHWAQRWHDGCDEAQVPALGARPAARAHAQLRAFASTDALAGLVVALVAPDVQSAAAAFFAVALVAYAGRRALQAVMALPPAHRIRTGARAVMGNRVATAVVAGILAIMGALFVEQHLVIGAMFLAPAALLGTAAIVAAVWRAAAWLELTAALPMGWREAVDRLEFHRFLHGRAMPDAGRPFGDRLGLGQRLRAIGEARRLQARELKARERPPRARPFALVKIMSGDTNTNVWRVIWYSLWALFAVARLVSSFGH